METQKAIIEHPLTVEQIILAYKALPAKDRKKVRLRLRVKGKLVSSIKAIRSTSRIAIPLTSDYNNEHSSPLTNQSPIPEWPFSNDKLWHLKVLVGGAAVDEVIQKNNGQLNSQTVIDLIKQSLLPYYVNEDMHCLSLGTSELLERDFGPLKPIHPSEALMLFGLAGMEEARERGFICI